jgi:hypothetical protein
MTGNPSHKIAESVEGPFIGFSLHVERSEKKKMHELK